MPFKPPTRLQHDSRLEHQIKTMTHTLGLGHSDMDQLCEWIVDGEPDVDEFGDETDSWRNVRPY